MTDYEQKIEVKRCDAETSHCNLLLRKQFNREIGLEVVEKIDNTLISVQYEARASSQLA